MEYRASDHGLDDILDRDFIRSAEAALERQEPVVIERNIKNVNRTAGAMLSGRVAEKYGHAGLPDGTITLKLKGTAGQSLGAFLAHGVTLDLAGEGNDYVGKGLSGGRIIVRAPESSTREPTQNIIVGNTVLYGAIAGEAYFEGVAGERFAVRNSGAVAVVEGTGDHGCEYMTGGVVVVLGKTGRNFAAGMSGGIAYVYDPDGQFASLANKSMCDLEAVAAINYEEDIRKPFQKAQGAHDNGMGDMLRYDAERLKILIERHLLYTGSKRARMILDNWDVELAKFVKVMPQDYRGALVQMETERLAAATVAAE